MGDQDYRDKCLRVFGREIDTSEGGFYIPFGRGTEEGRRLLTYLWQVHERLIEPFFIEMRDRPVPGAIVEFGVFQGSALGKICAHCERLGLNREIYGFDSFEGLPEPSEHDPPKWWKGRFDANFDQVQERLNVAGRPYLHLIKGWFSESFKDPALHTALREIAYARIDCDMYQSTHDCLGFLDDKLADGAFMTLDDWTHGLDQAETKAFFEWSEKVAHKYRFEFLHTIAQGIVHLRVWHRTQ